MSFKKVIKQIQLPNKEFKLEAYQLGRVKNIETGAKSTASWWLSLTMLRFLCNNQTVPVWETLRNIYFSAS